MVSNAVSRCFHCNNETPTTLCLDMEVFGEAQHFCCPGCRAAAQTIINSGLSNYYKERTSPSSPATTENSLSEAECHFFDDGENQRDFTAPVKDKERRVVLSIEGMQCAACCWLIKNHLSNIEGVHSIHVNPVSHQAQLNWNSEHITLSKIINLINQLGYKALPLWNINEEAANKQKASLKRLGISGLGMMQVMMFSVGLYAGTFSGIETVYESLLRWVSFLVASIVLVYAGSPFFLSAFKSIKIRRLNMDVPVSLALVGAYFSSIWATVSLSGEVYFDSVTMFIFFLTLGRYLEASGRYKANLTSQSFLKFMPQTALRLQPDGNEEVVSIHKLNPNDMIRVKPGDTIPVDAIVVDGKSSTDESLLTGEIRPQKKMRGNTVSGGSQNIESLLTLKVARQVDQSLLSCIMQLMERGLAEKPGIALLADKVARYFVTGILFIAAAVFVTWWYIDPQRALWITLSVLVITCPCALSLATPVALTAASNHLMRNGILLTRSNVLEKIIKADTIVFDKTGTLTEGRFSVKRTNPFTGLSELECFSLASLLERNSEHPISKAFTRNHVSDIPTTSVRDIKNVSNNGVQGEINGTIYRIGKASFVSQLHPSIKIPSVAEQDNETTQLVYLSSAQGPIACFNVSDSQRTEVPDVLAIAKSLGMRTVMLSGDPSKSAMALARSLNFDAAQINCSPSEKMEFVRSQQEQGHNIIMVGDGINDAPVLAQADVSFALGNGTELAKTSADVVLLNENLLLLVTTREIARKTLKIIRQNMAWALTYNGLAVPLAAFGFIEPYMAVIGMSASSLLVMLNSLRLNR